ncbi:MAG: 50S ribosomal protein L30e [Candidatus Nezhaarchaeales archaeon]
MVDIINELKIAEKTGELILGSRETVKAVMQGKGKLIIIASNCPERIKKTLTHYAQLSSIPIHICSLTSKEIGEACGKRFMVASLLVLNEGESEILKLVSKE